MKKTIQALSLFLACMMIFTLNFGMTANAERVMCYNCAGTGSVNCVMCGGSGGTYQRDFNGMYVWTSCSMCGGNGRMMCSTCNGSGYVDDGRPVDSGDDSGDGAGAPTVTATAAHGDVYDATPGVVDMESAPYLFDGDVNTKFNIIDTKGFVCWKAPKLISVSSYVITTANDTSVFTGRNMKKWVLYGSNKKLKRKSKNWVKIHAVSNDKKLKAKDFTSYTFKLKKAAKAYRYYKLEILDNKGDECTQMAELKLKGKTYTAKKTSIVSAVKKGRTAITVKWKKQSPVKGYELQYSTSAKFKKKTTVTVKKATTVKKTVKSLKKGKKYYVRVRTYRVINGYKVTSKWSRKKAVQL